MSSGLSVGRRTLLLAALPLVGATMVGTGGSAHAATARASAPSVGVFAYQGSAYGTSADLNGTVTSGPSAPVYIGCSAVAGRTVTNTTVSTNTPAFTTGTVSTTGTTYASPVETNTTATTQAASVLGGLVTATTVEASSSTSRTATGFALDASGTTFVGLVVAGTPISGTPPPNTQVTLPGVGYVVLNEQVGHTRARSASLTVNAIRVVVTITTPLAPAGTQVVISHAYSALAGPEAELLDGRAYGSRAAVNTTTITSGPSFLEVMPCLGTKGAVRSDTGAGVSIPGGLTTGTITDTAQGTVSGTSATGEMTSTIQNVNLLGGTVTATAVKADATATTDGTTSTFGYTGSQFVSLTVSGQPSINDSVPPNTSVAIPGVGTLYLYRVITHANSIEVRMIELVLTQASGGLPAGTDIEVGVAEASVHPGATAS